MSNAMVMRGMNGEPVKLKCVTADVTFKVFGQSYQVGAAVMGNLLHWNEIYHCGAWLMQEYRQWMHHEEAIPIVQTTPETTGQEDALVLLEPKRSNVELIAKRRTWSWVQMSAFNLGRSCQHWWWCNWTPWEESLEDILLRILQAQPEMDWTEYR